MIVSDYLDITLEAIENLVEPVTNLMHYRFLVNVGFVIN